MTSGSLRFVAAAMPARASARKPKVLAAEPQPNPAVPGRADVARILAASASRGGDVSRLQPGGFCRHDFHAQCCRQHHADRVVAVSAGNARAAFGLVRSRAIGALEFFPRPRNGDRIPFSAPFSRAAFLRPRGDSMLAARVDFAARLVGGKMVAHIPRGKAARRLNAYSSVASCRSISCKRCCALAECLVFGNVSMTCSRSSRARRASC